MVKLQCDASTEAQNLLRNTSKHPKRYYAISQIKFTVHRHFTEILRQFINCNNHNDLSLLPLALEFYRIFYVEYKLKEQEKLDALTRYYKQHCMSPEEIMALYVEKPKNKTPSQEQKAGLDIEQAYFDTMHNSPLHRLSRIQRQIKTLVARAEKNATEEQSESIDAFFTRGNTPTDPVDVASENSEDTDEDNARFVFGFF